MSTRVHIERRLAAIVFADVAGYSRLIERNDVETTRKWRALRENLIAPKISEHFGRLVRTIGDGLLIEFRSVVDAVVWARDVQHAIEDAREAEDTELIVLRIGINVEDVIIDGDDLHGDGVNIAARIQQLANPGEVVVTAAVSDYVRNKLSVTFTDLGDRELKNISRPIRIYRLELSKPELVGQPRGQPYLAWTNRPSIALLPFRNSERQYRGELFRGRHYGRNCCGAGAQSFAAGHCSPFDATLRGSPCRHAPDLFRTRGSVCSRRQRSTARGKIADIGRVDRCRREQNDLGGSI